jgi:diguanylate cyclase (GGDEF)-like protein
MVNGEVKGIIHLDSRKKDAFDQDDMGFTEILANEIAIAMERSFLYAQVRDIAIRDGLTGCFNRRKFDVDIVAELASAKQLEKHLSLLMLDIDWFKKYNDCHGHQKGDDLLKRLVQILELNVRPGDSIYRYGGEEFAILLPEAGKETARYIAERLRDTLEREQFQGEETSQPGKQVTISIGMATFPEDATAKDDLIRAADAALYRAKQTGRNRTCTSDVKTS